MKEFMVASIGDKILKRLDQNLLTRGVIPGGQDCMVDIVIDRGQGGIVNLQHDVGRTGRASLTQFW